MRNIKKVMFLIKRLKVCAIAAILVSMIFISIGCGKSNSKTNDTSILVEKLDNPNITVLSSTNETENKTLTESFKQFEEKYGGKVDFISILPNETQSKLAVSISAGDSPDVVFWSEQQMPQFILLDLLEPIEDYIDVKNPIWDINIMNNFKLNGKYYAVPAIVSAHIIYYNKTLFENNGVETPMEYYKKGQWNWSNFRKVAMALTQDTNGDGAIDQYGFEGTTMLGIYLSANDTDIVQYNKEGVPEISLKDDKTIETLQFVQDSSIKDKYAIYTLSSLIQSGLPTGKSAMVSGRSSHGRNLKGIEMPYEWDIVPFPAGPSNKSGVVPGHITCWGFVTGAKNPHGAAAWLVMDKKARELEEDEDDVFNSEQKKLVKELKRNIVTSKYLGYGDLQKIARAQILNPITKAGTPIMSIIETILPVVEEELKK